MRMTISKVICRIGGSGIRNGRKGHIKIDSLFIINNAKGKAGIGGAWYAGRRKHYDYFK